MNVVNYFTNNVQRVIDTLTFGIQFQRGFFVFYRTHKNTFFDVRRTIKKDLLFYDVFYHVRVGNSSRNGSQK